MKTHVGMLFWLRTDKTNSQDLTPISCRLTTRGSRAEITTHIRVQAAEWSKEQRRVMGNTAAARTANAALTKLQDQLTDIWADLERQKKPVTAGTIALLYRRNGAVFSLVELLGAFMAERAELVGVEICARTLVHQQTRYNRLKDFLKKNRLGDLRPEEFTHSLADKFLYWLIRELDYSRNSANKVVQFLFQALRWGVRREHVERNPLDLYKFKAEAGKEIIYLEADEVERLACFEFATPRLGRVRDCFIFQCWTGLAYADLAALNIEKQVETSATGRRFLRVRRAKSTLFKGYECVIPLLPEAERLLAHYGDALPVYTGQYYNRALKEIGQLAGLAAEKMHTHVGRKTAGTLMLNKGIPIEAVSKFLGHSNIKITQKLYAKLLDTTVLDAFDSVFGEPTPPPSTAGLLAELEADAGRVVPMYRAAKRTAA